jgi:hypothetical protein
MKTFEDYEIATASDVSRLMDRILQRLQDDADCYYPSHGAWRLTPAQESNWQARQTVIALASGEDAPKYDSPAMEEKPASVAVDIDDLSLEELERLTAPDTSEDFADLLQEKK